MPQNHDFRDLNLEGQGPKFDNFYSRQRRNLSEILNDIAAKCDFDLEGQGPKFNHFYSRIRRNWSEILNDIGVKL